MKRGLIVLLLLGSLVFFSSAIFAQQSCSIKTEVQCLSEHGQSSDYILAKLSDTSNAHGELRNGANYDYVICCDFPGASAICSSPGANGEPGNKVLGLSGTTNAHAEIPGNNIYNTDVCYGDLSCINTLNSCGAVGTDAANYPIGIVSLSGTTNAHIGPIDSYSTKICCVAGGIGTSAIWTKNGLTGTSTIDIIPDKTQIYLLLKNTNLPQGTQITFKIKEGDNITSDDDIKTTSAQVDANKKAQSSWTITTLDLNNGDDALEFETQEQEVFYFEAYDGNNLITTSQDLDIGSIFEASICQDKTTCSEYSQENYCTSDICTLIQNSVPSGTNCTGLTSCFCSWNQTTTKCDATVQSLKLDENGNPQALGQCIITANKDSDPNGCDDGQITYSWTAEWTGTPEDRPSSCTPSGGYSLSCPSEVQLPFFGFYNFIAAFAFVMAIYLLLGLLSRRKSRLKRKKAKHGKK